MKTLAWFLKGAEECRTPVLPPRVACGCGPGLGDFLETSWPLSGLGDVVCVKSSGWCLGQVSRDC